MSILLNRKILTAACLPLQSNNGSLCKCVNTTHDTPTRVTHGMRSIPIQRARLFLIHQCYNLYKQITSNVEMI